VEALTKNKILLLDDNADVLDTLEILLEDDFDVYKTTSAKEALEIRKKQLIQIVISDLEMPEMNGIDFCEKVKDQSPVTIVVALTGKSKIFEIVQCRYAGFDDYIMKPFDPEEFKEIILQKSNQIDRWKKLKLLKI
jgi:DNA-binding response OmpR family regulator